MNTSEEDIAAKLKALKADMPYKWRVQSFSKFKPECTCVAYVDSRDVQDRLDEVFPGLWQDKYEEIKGNLYCSIGIFLGGQWVWRTDCGTESNVDKQKGEASDAFKRAAVKFGPGRFLYSLGMTKLASAKDQRGKDFVADHQGKRIWDISKHINAINAGTIKNKPAPPPKPDPKKQPASKAQMERLGELFGEGLMIPPGKQTAYANAAAKLDSNEPILAGWAGSWIKYLKDLKKDQDEIIDENRIDAGEGT